MKTTLGVIFALLSLSASAQSPFGRSAVGGTFQQLAEITGTQGGDDFGLSVAVSGNTLVVGVPLASNVCTNCGAAYVYTAINGDWANLMQVASLFPPPGQSGFGNAVAVNGDTIVVGDDGPTEAVAYVYVNPSGNATPSAELTTSVENGDAITSIGIGGNTIVLGTPFAVPVGRLEGAAFVYVEPSTGWSNMTESAELISTDENTDFGYSVSISGRNIAVGAPLVKLGGVEQGAAYLFVEPTAGWGGTLPPKTELEASNGTRNAQFGLSVSVSGDTVAVGAPEETVGSRLNQGAVYMFVRPSSGWPKTMTETTELMAGAGGSELGTSLALSGKTLAAGAPFAHSQEGLVYVFLEPSAGWQGGAKGQAVAASDGVTNDIMGYSVSIDSGVIAAGTARNTYSGRAASNSKTRISFAPSEKRLRSEPALSLSKG
jgi:hypothetical protein